MDWIKIFTDKIDLTSVLIAFFLISAGLILLLKGDPNPIILWSGVGCLCAGSLLSVLSWVFNSMKEHFQTQMKGGYENIIKNYKDQVTFIQRSNKNFPNKNLGAVPDNNFESKSRYQPVEMNITSSE